VDKGRSNRRTEKSRNEEFRNIIRMIKSKMGWAGHVVCMVKMRKLDAAEFLAEPTVVNFVQKSPCPAPPPHFMELEGSLASSQKPTTVPYHEPNEPSLRCMLMLSCRLFPGISSSVVNSSLPTKAGYTFLIVSMRTTCLAHRTALNFIFLIFGEWYKL